MIKVGLTGGIGSGKSVISKIFRILDIPVYFADQRAKELMENNEIIKSKLMDIFGKKIYHKNKLQRKLLSQIIFKDGKLLQKVNSIVHPIVRDDFIEWMKYKTGYKYVIEEAAILFETGYYKEFDKIITVIAPVDLRIQRIILRDNTTENEVKQRMKNQWEDEDKIKYSDYIIINDDKELVIPQVLKIHKELQNLKIN
ncbi:MAG: dephospho-CoA kinase [Bacteroidales bacterium]|nr:dephospho-CoA kinase [Bacteroidales bacterium]